MKTLLGKALAGQGRLIRLAMLCAALAALAAVGLLAVSGQFLASAGLAGATGVLAVQGFNYLLPSAFIRAAAITRTAARYGERMLGHRAALFALAELRGALFARVASAVLAGRRAGRSGDFAARMGQDVDALEEAVIRRVSSVGAAVAGVGGLIAALAMGWRAAVVLAITLAAMLWVARTLSQRLMPTALARQSEALTALKADYADIAVPVADIAVYGLAPRLSEALTQAHTAYAEARNDIVRIQALVVASQTLLAAAGLAAMLLTSRADGPELALGLLGAMAALEIWAPLASHALRAPDVALAEARLAALPDATAPVTPLPAEPALSIGGHCYPAGSRIQIAGPSGSGKTRLIETLAGLRRDAPQDLAVAGHNPRGLGLASLRPVFALATQDAPLIAGSVADNLMLARPGLGEDDLWQALTIACADDVVRALPDGLQHWLGGDGARLSGGQRRRIALARALLADRPWLVLDEPSEGLDSATEARLVDNLARWLDQTGTGLILVSHRPAMIILTDRRISL